MCMHIFIQYPCHASLFLVRLQVNHASFGTLTKTVENYQKLLCTESQLNVQPTEKKNNFTKPN